MHLSISPEIDFLIHKEAFRPRLKATSNIRWSRGRDSFLLIPLLVDGCWLECKFRIIRCFETLPQTTNTLMVVPEFCK